MKNRNIIEHSSIKIIYFKQFNAFLQAAEIDSELIYKMLVNFFIKRWISFLLMNVIFDDWTIFEAQQEVVRFEILYFYCKRTSRSKRFAIHLSMCITWHSEWRKSKSWRISLKNVLKIIDDNFTISKCRSKSKRSFFNDSKIKSKCSSTSSEIVNEFWINLT